MSGSNRILLVEDDPNLGELLSGYLRAKGFQVELRTDGEQGLKAYQSSKFDILILDVMMPMKDGFTLAKEIRETDQNTPIIFLTAKSMKQDTIRGFEAGGDDYITKPFSMEELLMRVNAVLRRTHGAKPRAEEPTRYEMGDSAFEPRRQLLTTPVGERKLTTKESELLRLLCANQNEVLERTHALQEVWGNDSYFSGRSMDVYIAKLRKYLREDPKVEIINVHGKGFRLITGKE